MDLGDDDVDEAGTSKAQGEDEENDSEYDHTECGGVDGEHKDNNDDEEDKDEVDEEAADEENEDEEEVPMPLVPAPTAASSSLSTYSCVLWRFIATAEALALFCALVTSATLLILTSKASGRANLPATDSFLRPPRAHRVTVRVCKCPDSA